MTAPKPVVLVVEDEPQMRKFLRIALDSNGYRLLEAATGGEASRSAASYTPHAVLLDLGLPDMDGLEVARRIREWTAVPILVISARGQEDAKVKALDRRGRRLPHQAIRCSRAPGATAGGITSRGAVARGRTGEGRHRRCRGGRPGHAPRACARQRSAPDPHQAQYKLLAALVRHAGMVLTHRHLLEEVWGPGHAHQMQYLRVYMTQLRHKLEREHRNRPQYLVTEPGVG